jgi:hypothetical protein
VASFFQMETDGFSGYLTLPDWLGVRPGVVGGVVLLIALAGFIAAEWAERKFDPERQEPESDPAADSQEMQEVPYVSA